MTISPANTGRSTARLLAVAALLAISIPLSACGGPSPAPSGTPTAAPTPTASPTTAPEEDPLDTVVAIVIRPLEIELRSADGSVVQMLDYMSAPADAIAVMTELFGAPPVDEEYPKTNHTAPGITHTWEDFVIDERFYDEAKREAESIEYAWPRFVVFFDGPTAHGLDLVSEQGFHADDPWSSLAGDPVFDQQLYTCVGTPIEILDRTRSDGQPETATVAARPSEDGSTVMWLGAPVMIADGCA
jgi:hypothetical protein